jgi:hypothetical protein
VLPVSEPQANVGHPFVLTAKRSYATQGFTSLGASWDTTRGWVGFAIVDCVGGGAPGVKVTIDVTDPLIRPYYYQGTLPSFAQWRVPVPDAMSRCGGRKYTAVSDDPCSGAVERSRFAAAV